MSRHAAPPARGGSLALLALAAALSLGALAADVAPALVPGPVGDAARAALAPTCHQRAERSLHLRGIPLASCARCTGLHAAGLLALAASALSRRRGLGVAAIAAATLLLADVSLGIARPAWDHPWLRFATGLLLGATLLAWGASLVERDAAARMQEAAA